VPADPAGPVLWPRTDLPDALPCRAGAFGRRGCQGRNVLVSDGFRRVRRSWQASGACWVALVPLSVLRLSAPVGLLGPRAFAGQPGVALSVGGVRGACPGGRRAQRPERIRTCGAGEARPGPSDLQAGCAAQLRVRAAARGAHGGGTGQRAVGRELRFRASLHRVDAQDAASLLGGGGGDPGDGIGRGKREPAVAGAQPCRCGVRTDEAQAAGAGRTAQMPACGPTPTPVPPAGALQRTCL
jgi:hypothetical protein